VPLALVSRLEEIPSKDLERSGGRWIIQHRGQLLPLLPITGSEDHPPAQDVQPVVVFSDGQQSLGLMVDRIQDIVDEPLVIGMRSQRPGVLGSAILSGKATDILDMQHYLMQVNPEWFKRPATKPGPKKVLLIDDSMFFRQLVRAALEADGYRTTAVESAERALELLTQGEKFDIVLCDIEMPGMDGCEFAAWFRQQPGTQQTPLVAITSLDGDVHGPRIMQAGFDRLLVKFHPQQLRDTLLEVLQHPNSIVQGLSA
jgi:two-component system chemotaxis sensor kinase CheA